MAERTSPLIRPLHFGYRFPWRNGNTFDLLVNAESFYPAMLAAIDDAKQYVLLEMYLVESGEVMDLFIERFCACTRRGLNVYLLLDGYGARHLSRQDRNKLRDMRVSIAIYNPLRYGKLRRNFFRDHRKLLIVDGEVAYIGGMGVADFFDPVFAPKTAWRETVVAVRGFCVGDWVRVFSHTWLHWSTVSLHLTVPVPTPADISLTAFGRVTCTWGRGFQEIKRSLIKRVRHAERAVWVATAYFVPSRKIRRALKRAARRGVDVRLLLPGMHTDHPAVRHAGRRFYFSLLLAGVRIFEYQPRFTHTKLLLCDGWVSIGSSNIDRWNLRWNLEANQEIEDEQFVNKVQAMFVADFAQSQEWTFSAWTQRAWYQRIQEWFWGRIDVWLDRWSNGHQFPSRSDRYKEHK